MAECLDELRPYLEKMLIKQGIIIAVFFAIGGALAWLAIPLQETMSATWVGAMVGACGALFAIIDAIFWRTVFADLELFSPSLMSREAIDLAKTIENRSRFLRPNWVYCMAVYVAMFIVGGIFAGISAERTSEFKPCFFMLATAFLFSTIPALVSFICACFDVCNARLKIIEKEHAENTKAEALKGLGSHSAPAKT